MRRPNERCSCGSGRKFKKCCYSRVMRVGEKDDVEPRDIKHSLALAGVLVGVGVDSVEIKGAKNG